MSISNGVLLCLHSYSQTSEEIHENHQLFLTARGSGLHRRDALVFGPIAAVCRDGLMESCAKHCCHCRHGGPPPPEHLAGCNAGYAGNPGTAGGSCTICEIGKYAEAGSATCTSCGDNTYTDAEGATSVADCSKYRPPTVLQTPMKNAHLFDLNKTAKVGVCIVCGYDFCCLFSYGKKTTVFH